MADTDPTTSCSTNTSRTSLERRAPYREAHLERDPRRRGRRADRDGRAARRPAARRGDRVRGRGPRPRRSRRPTRTSERTGHRTGASTRLERRVARRWRPSERCAGHRRSHRQPPGILKPMPFPQTRLRRLRATGALRGLVRETSLSASDFVYPMFVAHGIDRREPIEAMPGVDRLSIAHAVDEAGRGGGARHPGGAAVRAPGGEGRGGLGGLGRRGDRPAGHARDQGGASRPARDHRSVPVRVHEPRPLRGRSDDRHGNGRQRRHARAARPHRRPPRPAPAPTSSRPAT